MHLNARLIYVCTLLVFLALAFLLQKKYGFLCDSSKASSRPYSYARTQLAWWSFIIIASFAAVVLSTGQLPVLDESGLLLLGIAAATTTTARVIDISDEQKAAAVAPAGGVAPLLSKDYPTQGFLQDILSDSQQISIHRLQSFLFNVIFGCWFIYRTYLQIQGASAGSSPQAVNAILPVLENNNLILLGISSGTYALLKASENK
jgi:hypothetical protein